jgi:outer membrane protein assembly factor BamB
LYGAFNNALQCLDLATGQLKWRTNNFCSPSVILADQHLLLLNQTGSLALVKASPLRYEELAYCPLPGSDYENSPAFSDGRIYVRCPSSMLCLNATVPVPLEIAATPLPGGTKLRVTVRCKDGSPIPTDRAPRVHFRWSSSLDSPPGQWPAWSDALVYTNGVLRGEVPLLRNEPARYFIAVEEEQ